LYVDNYDNETETCLKLFQVVSVFCFSFYPRDAMLARVFPRATCPSVQLSRAGIVSKRRRFLVVISSLSGSHTNLVFWCQISSRQSKGFPERGP